MQVRFLRSLVHVLTKVSKKCLKDNSGMTEILVVEDDEILNEGLCYNLRQEGYDPFPAYNLKEAKSAFSSKEYALILLDVNFPEGDGYRFARLVRENSQVPVFFLTACDMDEDIMKGFDCGADDYMTKPFNVKILMQRIRAVLRRYQGKTEEKSGFRCGNLEIDMEGFVVKKSGKPLTLTPTEYKLLFKLCCNPNMVLTRRVLLEEIWDAQGNFVDEHALTVQMSRLKNKISDQEYTYIKTVYGMGYQWIGERHE